MRFRKNKLSSPYPPLFRHFDGAVLLQLVIIFGRAARYLNGDVREFRNRYDYASTLAEFLEGARLIIGAPDALHEVMRSESRFRASKFLGEVKRYARQVGTVAAQEAAVGIAKALKPDAPRHISAISTARKKHGLLTLKEMAADMGLPDKSKIKALVDAGLLSSETQPGDFKRITYVRRIEFERLKASIADRVSSMEVCQATGWKAYHLEQFVDAGLLEWHPSQAIPHLYCREYVERDPFEALVRRIRTQIPNLPAEDERIPLSKLYPVIGATHKPLATVVKTALTFNNQLELGIVDPSGPLVVENLSVPMRLTGSVVKGDVPWYQLPFTRPYMMQEEVQEYLNLLPKNLFQLLRCGILEYASFNRVRIATDTVVQAGVDYIGAWEIAARIGNTAKQSARWAQERDLKKPSKDHDLWRREDVEVFLPANRYLTHVTTTTKPVKRMPQFGPEIEEEECPGVRRAV